jgi:DNA-binding beta-propeller fold protein YncE/4-amino-4-deoxy-L-arabinose transferase-like glycosyltransferase
VFLWWHERYPNRSLAINILSLFLFFLAFHGLDRRPGQQSTPAIEGFLPRWTELLLVGLILMVALFLRGYRLADLPYGIWYDEGEAGLEAIRIYQGMPFTPIGTYSPNNPSLFFYLVAFAYKLLGINLLALRLTAAVVGVLTVATFYVLVKAILGHWTAIVAAALLAASSWHVNFSRFAMGYVTLAPLMEITALYFLLKGLRSGRRMDFAWGGLMIGLGMSTYTGFRLFPAVVVAYVLYGLLLNRDRVRHHLGGIAIYVAIGLIVFTPLGVYALKHPKDFGQRMAQTSLFAEKDTWPARISALESNIRKHVLMFNVRGDGNGRHGVPGAPTLDLVTASLFVVGFGYCLYRWRSPAYFVLFTWFLVTMLAGILSLDWEAPQAARSVVAIPAVYAMAAVPLGKAWRTWTRAGPATAALSTVAVAGILIGATALNYDRYFHKQMGLSEVYYAFSVQDTAIARHVLKLGKGRYRFYLQNQGTPAYRFLIEEANLDEPLDTHFFRAIDHLPVRKEVDKDIVYILEPWRVSLPPQAFLHYYPQGVYEEIADPFGKTLFFTFTVSKEDAAAILGLRGRYDASQELAGEPGLTGQDSTLDFDWQSSNPLHAVDISAQWEGSLFIPHSGVYTFVTTSGGASQVRLDEELVVDNPGGDTQAGNQAGGTVQLAKGWHALEVTCLDCAGGPLQFGWQPPGSSLQVVPQEALSVVSLPSRGLRGHYYQGKDWAGPPAFVQTDPIISFRWHDDPLPVPWSAEWSGTFQVAQSGPHHFELFSNDYAELFINGEKIVGGYSFMAKTVQLDAGPHDIVVRYSNTKSYSEMRLRWAPPGGSGADVIPTDLLVPATGELAAQLLAELPPPLPQPTPAPSQVVVPPTKPLVEGVGAKLVLGWGQHGTGRGEFDRPEDVAVSSAGDVYVVDTGNRRVQRFNSDGQFLSAWGREGCGGGEFVEPFAAEVDGEGNVWVLDAGSGRLQLFTPEGRLLSAFGGDLGFYWPRGLSLGPAGNLYVADTGSNRIMVLSPDGHPLLQFGEPGTGPGQFNQPRGVAVAEDGTIFVVDSGNMRIQTFDSTGYYRSEWPLPWASSFVESAPRIALGPGGRVFLTDPDHGRIREYSAEGQLLAEWGEPGSGPGQLARPAGIAVGQDGSIYVVELESHRIQKFEREQACTERSRSIGG